MQEVKYELLNPLPDWAYIKDEIIDMVLSADKKIDGCFYAKIIETKSDYELLFDNEEIGD